MTAHPRVTPQAVLEADAAVRAFAATTVQRLLVQMAPQARLDRAKEAIFLAELLRLAAAGLMARHGWTVDELHGLLELPTAPATGGPAIGRSAGSGQ